MKSAPCARLRTPSVPRMIVSPLLTSASSIPRARPLKACDINSGALGILAFVIVSGGRPHGSKDVCPYADVAAPGPKPLARGRNPDTLTTRPVQDTVIPNKFP